MNTLAIITRAAEVGLAHDLDVLVARAAGLAENTRAANIRRAYRSDWVHFERWCTAQGFVAIPAAPAIVGLYLTAHEGLSVATLSRRVSSIGAEHRLAGHALDVCHPAIADVLRGLRRERGSAHRHAEALTTSRLKQVLGVLGTGLGDHRDRALLLVATAAALRRSEIVALDIADIAVLPEGLRVEVRRSKTDAEGHGATLAVSRTGTPTCPAAAYEAWLAASGITRGVVVVPQLPRHRMDSEAGACLPQNP